MPARYRLVKVNGRSKLLHRHVMEQHLGRALRTDEHVHHRNGNRFDNRLENLEVLSAAAHMHLHKQRYPTEKNCVWCGAEFTPHPTKRKRAETCSKPCGYALRWARRKSPPVAAALVRANCPELVVRDEARSQPQPRRRSRVAVAA